MKRRAFGWVLASCVVTSCCTGLRATALALADYNTGTNAPSLAGYGIDWNYVYNYKGSSAVAVNPFWLLTARHVGDDNISSNLVIGGTTYHQQEVVLYDPADDPDPGHTNYVDLAMVRYDKAFPGYYPLYTGGFTDTSIPGPDKRIEGIIIGYGNTGTVSSVSYTDSGSGSGIERWGTQKIDGATTLVYTNGVAFRYTGLIMGFTLLDTSYEGGLNVHDSGGGTFVNDGGTWKLAGINTVRAPPTAPYTTDYAVSVPEYYNWIVDAVPEPTAAVVMVFGTAVFVLRRRFRTAKRG